MAQVEIPSMSGASDAAGRPPAATRVPALENGDHLTRCEFERRYAARPDLKKAELIDGEYRPPPRDARGVLHSKIFPGLRLAVGAMLEGDVAGVLAEQRKGVRTRRHREFVARLAARKSP